MVTIYALECRINGNGYIGSTKGKLAKRLREHRCLLNAHRHKTPRLQADWQEYGECAFEMKSLGFSPLGGTLDERRQMETFYMRQYQDAGRLYNEHIISMQPTPEAIRRGVESARHVIGKRWSPEANEKRRMAQLGKPKGHGAKISATKRARKNQGDEIV